MTQDIPDHIIEFLQKYCLTIGHLDLLLFLFDGREHAWTLDDLRQEMRTNSQMAEQQILDLADCVRDSGADIKKFQFATGNLNLLEVVREISELSRTRKHRLTRVIYGSQKR